MEVLSLIKIPSPELLGLCFTIVCVFISLVIIVKCLCSIYKTIVETIMWRKEYKADWLDDDDDNDDDDEYDCEDGF